MSFLSLFRKIEGKGFDSASFCMACGFSRSTFSKRMSGETEFTAREIEKMVEVLGLTMEETREIFFTDNYRELYNNAAI